MEIYYCATHLIKLSFTLAHFIYTANIHILLVKKVKYKGRWFPKCTAPLPSESGVHVLNYDTVLLLVLCCQIHITLIRNKYAGISTFKWVMSIQLNWVCVHYLRITTHNSEADLFVKLNRTVPLNGLSCHCPYHCLLFQFWNYLYLQFESEVNKALLFHQSYLLNYMYMKFTHAYNLHISITSVPEISYVFASCVSVLKNYISSPRMTIILHGEFWKECP